MAAKLPPVQIVRRITLGLILVGLTTLMVLHQRIQGIPSIDALDPFGGLETLLKWVAGGDLIKKIEPGTLVLFGGILALGLVLSRVFCGWFCAFGALQGVFGWIGRKLLKRRFVVPAKLDRALRWLKYPILVGIVAWTWQTGTLVIRPYDPLAAFGHMSAGLTAVWTEFAVGLVILVVVMIASMFYERVFCKYVCPLGAVNAILGRLPLFRLKRVESTCISCSRCDASCPMNIDVSTAGAIGSPECISCMECVSTCPTKKKSLVATLGGRAVKVSTVVILGFAIYFGRGRHWPGHGGPAPRGPQPLRPGHRGQAQGRGHQGLLHLRDGRRELRHREGEALPGAGLHGKAGARLDHAQGHRQGGRYRGLRG